MVKFKKETHQYFTSDNRELVSVSAFIKRFEPKINWTAKAAKVAKREGKSTQEILDLWDLKRKKGSEAGTILHSMREQELIDSPFFEFEGCRLGKKLCSHENGLKLSIPVTEIENNHVYPEFMIYDLDYMICGQSDKVIVKDNKINIYDYKTDKEISFKAYSNQWTPPEKLLPPLSHLDDCNGNKYALKMSLYMYLLWKANKTKLKPGKVIIEWNPLERDEEGFPVLYEGKPKAMFSKNIEIPYLKKEIIDVLKTLK